MGETRKLAAILVSDVVGYSRLTGADEDRILARLRTLSSDLIDPTIAVHHGRIVKRTGDGSIVEFRSVVDAVRCAIEVQNAMVERNAGVPTDRRIDFRIGIHLGDVVEESDGDLMGDGVNIAARLEGIAAPGAIYLSEDAYRQVKARLDLAVTDLGEKQLKNIVEPVRVYSLQVGVAAQPKPEPPRLALPDKPSIAVLPFTNMSGDPEQDYFADGMVEDIITGLSRIKWLFVVARNSSFTYKGQAVSVNRVGRELGVRYLLEGSVRKVGPRVRITGQLVEAETGVHIWAERYDRPLDDIFALQDEITLNVVGAIEPSLREAEIERVKRKRPENLDAYDLVSRALPHVVLAMPAEAAKAMPLLEKALTIEGDYAAAHGLLAWCHHIFFARRGYNQVNHNAAIRHARAALAYGRDNATALALGGFVISITEHDRATAFEASEQALAISPSSSFALFCGSAALAYAGEAERGIDWAERALRISPFDRMNHLSYHALAIAHFLRCRYHEAAHAARRCVQSIPSSSVSRSVLAAALAKLGRIEEAKAVALQVLALDPSFSAARFCAATGLVTALAEPMTD